MAREGSLNFGVQDYSLQCPSTRFGSSKYTSLKTTLQNATPN